MEKSNNCKSEENPLRQSGIGFLRKCMACSFDKKSEKEDKNTVKGIRKPSDAGPQLPKSLIMRIMRIRRQNRKPTGSLQASPPARRAP